LAARRDELERKADGTLDIHSIHEEIRQFWEDEEALEYPP
jgi:hypothetical protein